jgi:Na+-driven multidrug efflux pump
VVQRTVGAAGVLGCGLGLALLAGRGVVPTWFTSDPTVLGLLAGVLPWVVLTQPVNALAFVWDGVLYGAGGFR